MFTVIRTYRFWVLLLILVNFSAVSGQTNITNALQQHINYLADDKLEGRATGSKGEALASDYIANAFKAMNLKPAGDNYTYLQAFDAHAGKALGANNYIKAGETFDNIVETYPHPMSANGIVTGKIVAAGFGIVAPTLDYNDYTGIDVKGKIVLLKFSSPDGTHPHSKYVDFNDAQTTASGYIVSYGQLINYSIIVKNE